MAKITLKIDGKNKNFVKNKLTFGAIRRQAEFEEKMQDQIKYQSEAYVSYQQMQKMQEEAEEKGIDVEEVEGFDELVKQLEAFGEKEEPISDVELLDDFANLVVTTFGNEFTYDDVLDGFEFEGGVQEAYQMVFADQSAGKPQKKRTTQTKTKQPVKS